MNVVLFSWSLNFPTYPLNSGSWIPLSKKSSWEAICLFHSCWLLLIWFGGFSFIIVFWNRHFLWNILNGDLDKVRITHSHIWWKRGFISQIISISPHPFLLLPLFLSLSFNPSLSSLPSPPSLSPFLPSPSLLPLLCSSKKEARLIFFYKSQTPPLKTFRNYSKV